MLSVFVKYAKLLRGFHCHLTEMICLICGCKMLFEITECWHPGVAVTITLFMQRESCKCSNLSAAFFHS